MKKAWNTRWLERADSMSGATLPCPALYTSRGLRILRSGRFRAAHSGTNKGIKTMKGFTIATATVGALAATALGLAGVAAAAPTGGSSASETVNSLQAQGYNVQLNGSVTAPLAQCTVTGVHGDSASPTTFTTVYVDVACPPSNN